MLRIYNCWQVTGIIVCGPPAGKCTTYIWAVNDILLCTNPRPGLQLLSRGPTNQQTALAQRVWALLDRIADYGKAIALQWIRGYAGIDGYEAADRIANRAAATAPKVTSKWICRTPGLRSENGRDRWRRTERHAIPICSPRPTTRTSTAAWGQTTVVADLIMACVCVGGGNRQCFSTHLPPNSCFSSDFSHFVLEN